MPNYSAEELRTINKQKRNNILKKYLFIFSIIGFQMLIFVVFYIIVNFNSILMAFQLKTKETTIWTFDNFTRMYEEFFGSKDKTELILALTNTFKFFVLGLIMFPVGFITSYFMYKKILGHSVYRLVFFIPSILSSIVWSTIYKEMVSVEGPIVKVLMWLTSSDEPMLLLADPQYALRTVMGYSIWMGIAGNFILYGGAMSRIPVDVIEAGQLDGIGWLREMVQIIIPLIFPTMGTLLLLQLTGIFTASGNILFLTGGAFDTTTISYFIFQSVYKVPETSNKYNYASAVGLVFTMLTLPIVFVTRWLLNKIEDVQY